MIADAGERRPSGRTPRPARVLVLIDTLAAGGAERLAVDLACSLDRSAFSPRVLVIKRGGPLEADLAAAGVPCTVLMRRRRTSVRPTVAGVRLARQSELIHSHLFGNNVWGALFARAAGVPLVAHEHNRVSRHSRFERTIDRWVIGSTASRILCVSEPAAEQLRGAGIDPALIEVVPNGVRLNAALPRATARRRLGLNDDAVVVGAVGALRSEKAHDLLLRAFARLVRSVSDRPGLTLCIVGAGEERTRLETLASQLGVTERIVWAGARDDAPKLSRAFDVSVLCSRSEGLPLAALEALAAGTPLVATRVGALPEVVEGGAGVLVDSGDEEGLARAIAQVLDDTGAANAIAACGKARAHARYDLPRLASRVEKVYRDILVTHDRRNDKRQAGVSVLGPPSLQAEQPKSEVSVD